MIASSQVTVGTSATRLSPAPADTHAGSSVAVKNTSASTIYLGGPGVTTSTGYPLAAGESFSVDLGTVGAVKGAAAGSSKTVDEALYAVAAASVVVSVLSTGV